MKFNLGCGRKIREGYLNIDMAPGNGIDFALDLRQPIPQPDGCVTEIYAQHLVEHFTRSEWPAILADWVRLLAPGGRLIIECPDLSRLCENFTSNKFGLREVWEKCIYGEDGPGMRHQRGVTIPQLRAELEAAGLTVVRARNWHDDYPEHMSDPLWHYNLRVEAVKP